MSNLESEFFPSLCKSDLDMICDKLSRDYYNANIPTITLTDEEQLQLKGISDELKNSITGLNANCIGFDEQGFMDNVIRVYSLLKNSNDDDDQEGGMIEEMQQNALVPFVRRPRINKYDFFAAIIFVVGIIFIVIAWYKLSFILTPGRGNLMEILRENFSSTPIANYNIIMYFFRALFGTAQGVIESQQNYMQRLLNDILTKTMMTDAGRIITNCTPKSDPSTILGTLDSFVTPFLGSSQTECMTQSGAVIAQAALDKVKTEIQLLTINISSQMQSVASITSYGAYCARFSLTYFAYRVGLFKNLPRLPPGRENAGLLMNEGGRKKTRKTRKTRKSKKTRKHKK